MDDDSVEPGLPAERELKELREREARYRERLSRVAERMQRLREHTASLLEILRRAPPRAGDVARTLRDVAQVSRRALGVARTSVWTFDPLAERLECVLMLGRDGDIQDVAGQSLVVADCPAYMRALTANGVLAVENTREDARMAGLEAYLRAHDVSALLDLTIAVPGERLGVVCHEHVGGPRHWEPEEIDFAMHVGNLVALALEVERRHAAEAKTVSAEARYRYLVESLPVTVYSFDAFSGRLEYLSPQFKELGALPPDELLARGVGAWLELIHPDDRAQVDARFRPHGVDSSPSEITYRVRPADGELRYVRDQCRVVRNHAGDPVAIQGVLADVTELHVSALRAAERERRLRNLLDNVELIGVVLDRTGRIEYVNPHFERTTGHRASEVLGVDATALLIEAAEVEATRARYLRDLNAGVIPSRFENEIITRGGQRRRVVWTTTILRAEDGTPEGGCGLGFDVTDRVRFEAALLQQTKLESLGQLSAGVAHDFNNLLTVLTCETDSLAKLHGDGPSRQSLRVIQQSLKQASELTRSLLVYARRDPVTPSALEVDPLIEQSAPLLSALAGKGLQFTRSLHAAGASVMIDPAQLRQVLMNLVGNAADATLGQGSRIALSTSIEYVDDLVARERGAAQAGSYVEISVADDGRGMDRRTLARVFEPFFTTKESGKGTGLGMAMCDAILRRARGFILVDSEPGGGTTCRAYLPIVAADGRAARVTPVPVVASGRPQVLLVEDEPLIRKQVILMLGTLPVDVRAVATVAQAREVLATEAIDLLITDGSLADGLGRILAEAARTARPEIRVLLVSGSMPDSNAVFDATLSKPFTSQQMLDAVQRLLPKLG